MTFHQEAPALRTPIPAITSCFKSGKVSGVRWAYLHVVDTVALIHAMILRIQALVMPVKALIGGAH